MALDALPVFTDLQEAAKRVAAAHSTVRQAIDEHAAVAEAKRQEAHDKLIALHKLQGKY